jgi:RNA polymerase sigma-70 factor (ECF subfamily)
MPRPSDPALRTRATLLQRLKNWQDQASWRDFFDTYWGLIYGVARKSGLTDAEAQDIVQETLVVVAKQMPNFTYDPSIGSFKAWLLKLTRWKILDQIRKRKGAHLAAMPAGDSSSGTNPIEKFADPKSQELDAVWEREWQRTLLAAAVDNVKRRVDPQKYQIFDFYVNKEWPPEKVAHGFGIPIGQVYLAKHRITEAIKSEVERLEHKMM